MKSIGKKNAIYNNSFDKQILIISSFRAVVVTKDLATKDIMGTWLRYLTPACFTNK